MLFLCHFITQEKSENTESLAWQACNSQKQSQNWVVCKKGACLGEAGVVGVLGQGRIHWVPEDVDTIEQCRGRSHDLHNEHKDAIGEVTPQVQRLRNSHPEVEHQRYAVDEHHRRAHPVYPRLLPVPPG